MTFNKGDRVWLFVTDEDDTIIEDEFVTVIDKHETNIPNLLIYDIKRTNNKIEQNILSINLKGIQ